MKLNSKVYDFLKWFALVAIPAFNIFILTIGKIWNLAGSAKIAATVSAAGILIAALIGVSGMQYWSDKSVVKDDDDYDDDDEEDDVEYLDEEEYDEDDDEIDASEDGDDDDD